MIEKFLLTMPCRFSNDHFALKKCRILHIENVTSNKKKKSGIKLLMNIVLISYLLHTFLKYEKKLGSVMEISSYRPKYPNFS